jgi:hypothetical protein
MIYNHEFVHSMLHRKNLFLKAPCSSVIDQRFSHRGSALDFGYVKRVDLSCSRSGIYQTIQIVHSYQGEC